MQRFVDLFTKTFNRIQSTFNCKRKKMESLLLINYGHEITKNKYLTGRQRMRDDEREETYSVRIINSYLEFLPAKSADEREM